jgi:hypothetical protein
MTKLSKAIVAAAAGAALLTAAAGAALAHGAAEPGGMALHMQTANMGQGHGGGSEAPSYGPAPCPGMKAHTGPGMTGSGSMMGHGSMTGHGMMGSGMMGHGSMTGHRMMGHRPMMGHGSMTGHRMMGSGMMGSGMMGHGMRGGGYGHGSAYGESAIQVDQDLSADDVRAQIERSLKWHGNERLKVGEVKELDDDTIVAEIVTLDDSLVDRLKVDRHTGSMDRIE